MQQPLQLRAIHGKDFTFCYYCGCIATEYDIVPKIAAKPLSVPCCRECYKALKTCPKPLVADRMAVAKKAIKKQHGQGLRIYQLWHEEELEEMDRNFVDSIRAGMRLGKETYERLNFKGFPYEIDGHKITDCELIEAEKISVFGQPFEQFRDALHYASKSFRVPKVVLSDLYFDHNQSFDKAIKHYQNALDEKNQQRILSSKCKIFAEKHTQNAKFIERTVIKLMAATDTLSIDAALQKIYRDYIL